MKRICSACGTVLLSLAVPCAKAAAPVVSNVRAMQEPGTKAVHIWYDVEDPDTSNLYVSVAVSTDDGARYNVPLPKMAFTGSGFGYNYPNGVSPGTNKYILWDSGADWRLGDSCDVRIKVTADDAAPTAAPQDMVLVRAKDYWMGRSQPAEPEDRRPFHENLLMSFYIDRYEVDNATAAAVFQWAKNRGYVGYYGSGNIRRLVGGSYRPEDLFKVDYGGTAPQSGLTYNGSVISAKAGRGTHPFIYVSWYGAVVYCNYKSVIDGLEPCYDLDNWRCDFTKNGYRLPTEAEWEAAAREDCVPADPDAVFPWCPADITHELANYYSTNGLPYDTSTTRGYHPDYDGSLPYTSPVGSFPAGRRAIFDMSGNVAEWCYDWYDPTYYQTVRVLGTWERPFAYFPQGPVNPPEGLPPQRIVRGGSWNDTADICDVTRRHKAQPGTLLTTLGFRVVRLPD